MDQDNELRETRLEILKLGARSSHFPKARPAILHGPTKV